MIDWKAKLTSRKFWAAVCVLATNLVIAFGGTEQVAVQITSIIMAGATVIAYIIGEGLIDAAGAANNTPIIVGTADWKPEEFKTEEVKSDVGEV